MNKKEFNNSIIGNVNNFINFDYNSKINYNFKKSPANLKYQLELFKSRSSEFEVFLSYKDNKEYIALSEEESGHLYIYSLFDKQLIQNFKLDKKIKQLKYYINNKDNNEYLIGICQEENNNENDHSYLIIWDITNNYEIKFIEKLDYNINNYCLAFPPNHNFNYIILCSLYKSPNIEGKIKAYSLNNFQFIKDIFNVGKSSEELLSFYSKLENKYYIVYMDRLLLINLLEDNNYYQLSEKSHQNGLIINKNNIDYLCCYYGNGIQLWDLYNKKIIKTIKINYLNCFIQWNNNYLIGFSADDHAFKIIDLEKGIYETNYINSNNKDNNNNPSRFMKKILHPKYGESLLTDSLGNGFNENIININLWSA